jgi:hypothetical protein
VTCIPAEAEKRVSARKHAVQIKQKLVTFRMPVVVKPAKKQKTPNSNSKNGWSFKGFSAAETTN